MKNLTSMAGLAALLCLSAMSAKAATLTNWARAGIATESTTYNAQGEASRAIDGNTLGGWSDATTSHTADSENNATSNPWWQVDLQEAKPISHLHLWFREDCCFVRNDNLRIVIFDSTNTVTRKVLWETNNVEMNGSVFRDIGYDVKPAVNGRVVYVEHLPDQAGTGQNFISITEMEVFNQPLTPPTNYALQGTATSSSCYVSDCTWYGPQQAIDGNHHGWTSVSGYAYAYSAPDNTAGVDPLPWWQLDLPAAKTVGSIVLWGRHDRTYARYQNIRLTVTDQNNAKLYEQVLFPNLPSGQKFVLNFVPALVNAKVVKIETTDATPDKFLNLPEVEVFAPLAAAPAITFTTNPQSITINENLVATIGPVLAAVDGGIRPEDISYRWYRNGVAIPGMSGNWIKSYTLPNRVTPASNGDKYKVEASVSGFSAFSAEATLTVTTDTLAPVLKSADGDATFTKVRVWFSEPLDTASAQTAANYQLSGGVTVTSAKLLAPAGSAGDNIVDLVTSAQTPGQTYTLTVTGVKDQSSAGNLVAAGSTVQFTAWTLAQGALLFEHFDNLGGAADADITAALANSRVIAGNATTVALVTGSFNTRSAFPDDSHENYLARVSGFITPKETADYYIFLRSDDASRLYLSTNETAPNPATDTPIAKEGACCRAFQEPGDAATTAEPIHLIAGKRYAVLALLKEAGGGDWMMVGWRKSDDTTAAASLPNLPGDVLSTYVNPNTDLRFVKQPANQPGSLPSAGIEILAKDFNTDDGGFTVEDTDPAPPGPWIYNSTDGNWAAEGGADGCGGPYNSKLTSTAYKLTQDGVVSLEFSHRYSFESDLYDAGLVRVSVNGGTFTLVPAENFTANGYAIGAIIGDGIAKGLRGFNADSPGYSSGQFITSKAKLGTFKKDDIIQVQFVGAWDQCTAGSRPNWIIDSMKLLILPMIIQDFVKNDGGFTVENTTPAPPGPWAYISTNGLWVAEGGADGCGGPFNSKLTSQAYTVPQADEVTLSFTHRYSFESDRYDAGLVRVSVNGGEFTLVPAENFSANGYAEGTIQGDGIAKGLRGFNADSPGFAAGQFITSSAILGTFKQNDKIVVQFVGAWDQCTAGSRPSWVIKQVQLAFGKAAQSSTFTAEAAASLRGEPAAFTYQWQRNDGTGFVNIPNATGAAFTLYPTAADFNAQFRVVVSVIGKSLNSDVVKLTQGVVVTPPELAIQAAAGKVTITFTGTLQSAASVNGTYQNVQGAASPYSVTNAAGVMFFRSAK